MERPFDKVRSKYLLKAWHKFILQDDGETGLLVGHFSQHHKRYHLKSCGKQGACNCVVACLLPLVIPIHEWNSAVLDHLLDLGDWLFHKSIVKKCTTECRIQDVVTNFYIHDYVFTIALERFAPCAQLNEETLRHQLDKVMSSLASGVVVVAKKRYFAFWKGHGDDEVWYYFDPNEYDEYGRFWTGVRQWGYCCLLRCPHKEPFVAMILRGSPPESAFEIYACVVRKQERVNTQPPQLLTDIPRPAKSQFKLTSQCAMSATTDPNGENVMTIVKPTAAAASVAPTVDDQSVAVKPAPRSITKLRQIPEPVRRPPFDILTATRSVKYSDYARERCIAALIMLREKRTALWTDKTITLAMRLGSKLYKEPTLEPMLGDRTYKLQIDDYVAFGQLQSTQDDLLNLVPVLEQFFLDNDTCIVMGPIVVAAWLDDDLYYMFDPNGYFVEEYASLAKFQTLSKLYDTYLRRVEHAQKRSRFSITRVIVTDAVPRSYDWNNFISFAINKWLLRASFNQHNYRFQRASRNQQDAANSLMALLNLRLVQIELWDQSRLNDILLRANVLYEQSLKAVMQLESGDDDQQPLPSEDINRHLGVEKIVNTFVYDQYEVNTEVKCMNDGNTTEKMCLLPAVEQYFVLNKQGVLETRGISLAFWKGEDQDVGGYFYFDPRSRDEQGLPKDFGTACCVRMVVLSELIEHIQTNLPATTTDDSFKLYRIDMELIELDENGMVRPPLNNFLELSDTLAILRADRSEDDSARYGENAGQQSVPMCLTTLGVSKLVPIKLWTAELLGRAMDKGDQHYMDSMLLLEAAGGGDVYGADGDDEANNDYAKEGAGDDEGERSTSSNATATAAANGGEIKRDQITSRNVKRDFRVGINAFHANVGVVLDQGTIRDNLEDCIREHVKAVLPERNQDAEEGDGERNKDDDEKEQAQAEPEPEPEVPEPPIDDSPVEDFLFETDRMVVVVWKEDKLFYLFDPKPRNMYGCGPAIVEEPSVDTMAEEEEDVPHTAEEHLGYSENEDDDEMSLNDDDKEDVVEAGRAASTTVDPEETTRPASEVQVAPEQRSGLKALRDAQEGEEEEEEGVVEKVHEYVEMDDGERMACVLRFRSVAALIQHLRKNHDRHDKFRLCSIRLENTPVVAEVGDNWNQFECLTVDKWILRGTKTLYDDFFPEVNRGKQMIPVAMAALAYNELYNLEKFTKQTVDDIVTYGDRLLSYHRKQHGHVQQTDFKVEDYNLDMCIDEFMVTMEVGAAELKGYVTAGLDKDDEEQLAVEPKGLAQGLSDFFSSDEGRTCLLSAKQLLVAVWRDDNGCYYMFDGFPRGPSGRRSPVGVACLTRFTNVKELAECFAANLEGDGTNAFYLYAMRLTHGKCPLRSIPKRPLGGFEPLDNYRYIVRSTKRQENGVVVNVKSSAVVAVCLAMTFVQETETWTKLTLDEISKLADNVYIDSVKECGIDFIDLFALRKDFMMKGMRVSFNIRPEEESGTLSRRRYLRKAIENFLMGFQHGVLMISDLVLGVWHQAIDELFMCDPNPRDEHGMPALVNGRMCVIKFANANLMADHVMTLLNFKHGDEFSFIIVPLDYVIGEEVAGASERKLRRIQKTRERDILKYGWHQISREHQVLHGSRKPCRNRDITSNVAAFVMSRLFNFDKWRCSHMDMVTDIGNQLYIDSMLAYSPENPKLGLENVLRRFYVNEVPVNLTVFKPADGGEFNKENVQQVLKRVFKKEHFCLLVFKDMWFGMFTNRRCDQEQFFYVYSPYKGCLDRFRCIPVLADKFTNSFCCDTTGNFEVILAEVDV